MTEAPRPKRREPSLSVKLEVALRALGVKAAEINWSHEPALELRAINDAGTDWNPAQHDPAFLFIRKKFEHDELTFKDNGTGRGDLTAIAHSKRLVKSEKAHGERIAAKLYGEPASEPERRKRTTPIRSAGFDKTKTRGFNGKVRARKQRRA